MDHAHNYLAAADDRQLAASQAERLLMSLRALLEGITSIRQCGLLLLERFFKLVVNLATPMNSSHERLYGTLPQHLAS